jgi:hypothetical protein
MDNFCVIDFAGIFIDYTLGVFFTWICVLHWLFSFTYRIIAFWALLRTVGILMGVLLATVVCMFELR